MYRLKQNKKGQFVMIALLIVAIMIVTTATLMHRAVTYYKHEPWEEYLTLIGNIELSSRRLIELSLANYTNEDTPDQNILGLNLEKWQTDLVKTYQGYGVATNHTLANGTYNVTGTNIDYSFGLNKSWDTNSSFSSANAAFMLGIPPIGLTGYKFTSSAFLNLIVCGFSGNDVNVTVKRENGAPVVSLEEANFKVNSNAIMDTASNYDETMTLVYTLKCNQTLSSPVTVEVWDQRGIYVRALWP